MIGIPIGLVVGLLLGTWVAMDNLPVGAVAPVLIAFWLSYWFFEARRKLALIRLLNVSHGAPRVPVAPGAPEALEIRVPTVGVLRMMLPFLGAFAIRSPQDCLLSVPAIAAAAVVLAIPVIAYFGYRT
ncbi:hypothetical protein AB0H42_35460 [Nocardia sp. NPDC050799]|uniref:hypothetical protein n=1 Tax=Nocardia sp. NPDC050799 TaxID=3154842 RepID=UPI0033D3EE54